jgi:hypothetical protein
MAPHMTYKGYKYKLYTQLYKNRRVCTVLAGDFVQVVYKNIKYR